MATEEEAIVFELPLTSIELFMNQFMVQDILIYRHPVPEVSTASNHHNSRVRGMSWGLAVSTWMGIFCCTVPWCTTYEKVFKKLENSVHSKRHLSLFYPEDSA